MHSEMGSLPFDVVPAQRAQLADAQAMAPAHTDGERVSQPISSAALSRRRDQGAAFVLGQILAHPNLFVDPAAWWCGSPFGRRGRNDRQSDFHICSVWMVNVL